MLGLRLEGCSDARWVLFRNVPLQGFGFRRGSLFRGDVSYGFFVGSFGNFFAVGGMVGSIGLVLRLQASL
jgi:hypothetical protein